MGVQIEEILNPRYADAAGSMIVCDVKFAHLPDVVGFAASPDDPEEHGRVIYAACLNGDFGAIAAYVPLPTDEAARAKIYAIEQRNPISQREMREFFLWLGDAMPSFKVNPMYIKLRAQEDLVIAERVKIGGV